MALHIEMTEEASLLRRTQKKKELLNAGVVSLMSLALLSLLFLYIKIYWEDLVRASVLVYADSAPAAINSEQEPTEMNSASSASPPSLSRVLTSTVALDVALPSLDMPMEQEELSWQMPSLGDGLLGSSDSWGDLGSGGGGFGSQEPGGSALKGRFYDLKQTKGGKATNLSESEYLTLLHRFVTQGWKESTLARYYCSPTELFISHFFLSKSDAGLAPKSFQCPPEVKASRWVAVYRGKVVAPVTGKFRFVGYGDDMLVVRFNGENVFDYGWYQAGLKSMTATPEWLAALKGEESADKTLKEKVQKEGFNPYPMSFYPYSSTPHWNQSLGGMGVGKTFSVQAGKSYPIEVLVSEIPGGAFGMALLIEEVGAPVDKRDEKTQSPILPLFRTNFALPKREANQDNPVPFLEESDVWRVLSP